MKELLRTVNPVDLSFAENLLGQHGIESFIFDTNTSVLDGSLGMFVPRRLMVADEQLDDARILLQNEGIQPYDGKPW